jgi:hypothetical protein
VEGGSKPYDSPYQLVEKGGKVLTDKSSPVSNCTYVMYNTPVGFSYSYLPFCWKTSLDVKNGSS